MIFLENFYKESYGKIINIRNDFVFLVHGELIRAWNKKIAR